MLTGVSNVNFNGGKKVVINRTIDNVSSKVKNSSEYIRGYRGIMDDFLVGEKLEKEQQKAIYSGNFHFLQGIKDAIAKIAKNSEKK